MGQRALGPESREAYVHGWKWLSNPFAAFVVCDVA